MVGVGGTNESRSHTDPERRGLSKPRVSLTYGLAMLAAAMFSHSSAPRAEDNLKDVPAISGKVLAPEREAEILAEVTKSREARKTIDEMLKGTQEAIDTLETLGKTKTELDQKATEAFGRIGKVPNPESSLQQNERYIGENIGILRQIAEILERMAAGKPHPGDFGRLQELEKERGKIQSPKN